MKKIGILGAMDEEVALLKASLWNVKETQWKHLTFYEGTLNDIEVVLVKCGIGNCQTVVSLFHLGESHNYSRLLNILF